MMSATSASKVLSAEIQASLGAVAVGSAVAIALAWVVLAWRQRGFPPATKSPDGAPASNRPPRRLEELLEHRWTEIETGGTTQALRVLTWNVLADAYAYGQRHCKSQVLRFGRRIKHSLAVIKRACADVLLLQEVDRLDEWKRALRELNYECVVARRDNRCRGDPFAPPDACVTAWRKEKFQLVSSEEIDYDDDVDGRDRLAKRYRRHNVGLVCVLRGSDRGRVVFANTHLHWDPEREDVKLAQMVSFLRLTASVAVSGLPLVVGGDWNSTPTSDAVSLALNGSAKLSAYYGHKLLNGARKSGSSMRELRLAIDFNLNRLCRWLRLCGVDAVLESHDQANERCRTAGKSAPIVQLASAERRMLVTASRTLAARREVISLPHLLVTSSMSCEEAFMAVIRTARVSLDSANALTRCVLCNGLIRELDTQQARALRTRDVDNKIPHDPDVVLFSCSVCAQTFWWSERGNSSAARAKELADKLFSLARKALEPPQAEKRTKTKARLDSSNCGFNTAESLIRSMTAGVSQPLRLRSCQPLAERHGVVTNFVPGFFGQIDYLLYSTDHFSLRARRQLPTVAQLKAALTKSKFLPCHAWPSDHIAVVADLTLSSSVR